MSSGERFKVFFAVYVILRKGNQVFMLRRANTGYRDGEYGLIQGHVEGGETVQECAAREAMEEAGITVDPKDTRVAHVTHGPAENSPGGEYVCVFLEADTWKGEPFNAEPEKCDDAKWFSHDALPENTIPNVRASLRAIAEGTLWHNERWVT